MAVVTIFASRWQSGIYLLGIDQYSQFKGYAMVAVSFGVYREVGPIQNILHARDKFKMWGLEGNEVAAVDGRIVDDEYILVDGHELVFHRP